MTVTKQQQLEWLAKECNEWPSNDEYFTMNRYTVGARIRAHVITREEWQQERDKMSSKPEVDNSLRKRGLWPPVGEPVELWFGGSFAYNCEFMCVRGNNYIVWNLDADRPDCADIMNSEFRPLRTKREKAIDAACNAISKVGVYESERAIIEKLYDTGLLK